MCSKGQGVILTCLTKYGESPVENISAAAAEMTVEKTTCAYVHKRKILRKLREIYHA